VGIGLAYLVAAVTGTLPLLGPLFEDDSGVGDIRLLVSPSTATISAGILLLVGLAAHAQSISVGVKAGSPVNDPSAFSSISWFSTSSHTQGRWTGGPTIEFHLPRRLSFEIDALYRSSRSAGTWLWFPGPAAPRVFSFMEKKRTWDFPLLGKYRLLDGPARPFLSAGYALSRESRRTMTWSSCFGASEGCGPAEANLGMHYTESARHRRGPVAAAGIEFKARRVVISPEVRVTRLNRPNTNQVTVMVGFTFKP